MAARAVKIEKPSIDFSSLTSAINRKKSFKQLPLLKQCTDFEIISQKCSLTNPLPKLLKWFRSVEQNGRQGYE